MSICLKPLYEENFLLTHELLCFAAFLYYSLTLFWHLIIHLTYNINKFEPKATVNYLIVNKCIVSLRYIIIKSIINKHCKVEITDEMREHFNIFAKDYRLIYMPDMNYYESFFETDQYAKSFGYNNFSNVGVIKYHN